MINSIIIPLILLLQGQIFIPISSANRNDFSKIKLTDIGQFGLKRTARSKVPEHYHTGINIKLPNNNYNNEPIFPLAKGKVISKRTDGAYAQLIIEHEINGKKFWTLYEHIAGIKVKVNDFVSPTVPIARFMNKDELNRFGWQFDHFHLEIIKVKPQPKQPDREHPERFYSSYTLTCYTVNDLQKYYFDPLEFIKNNLSTKKPSSPLSKK